MKKKKFPYGIFVFFTIAIILVFGNPIKSFAQDSIQWVDVVLPPIHHINEGIWKGEGISDNIIKLMIEKLDDFEHTQKIQPLKRVLMTLKLETNACNPSFKKNPDRESYMYYSIPSVFIPGHGITVRKKDLHLFGDPPVSLGKLLKTKKLRLGIAGGRSYGKGIDLILEKFKNEKHINRRAAQDSYGKQVEMMVAGRIDYVLGYSTEFGYIKMKMGNTDQIKFLTIKEADPYSITYVACSRTEQGKKIINRVNEVLLKERPTERYRSFVERWLDKSIIPEYRKAYNDLFLKIKK